MHPFQYVAPSSVQETISVLAQHGSRARPMAGGTDVLVQTRVGRYELDAIVDVKGIAELMELRLHDDGLHIGAAVPCYQLYEDASISAAYPGIMDAASLIGGIQIQSRASLGGNLCNAAPSADGICPLIVHSATAVIASPSGTSKLPVEEFCTGPGQTVLGDGNLLVALDIPKPPAGFGAAYERFIPRNEMDIAVAGVASAITLTGGNVTAARIALASVGPTPINAAAAADSLLGKPLTDETIAEAAELASQAASPIDDMRGTVAHRLGLVRTLTRRTLAKAAERARGAS